MPVAACGRLLAGSRAASCQHAREPDRHRDRCRDVLCHRGGGPVPLPPRLSHLDWKGVLGLRAGAGKLGHERDGSSQPVLDQPRSGGHLAGGDHCRPLPQSRRRAAQGAGGPGSYGWRGLAGALQRSAVVLPHDRRPRLLESVRGMGAGFLLRLPRLSRRGAVDGRGRRLADQRRVRMHGRLGRALLCPGDVLRRWRSGWPFLLAVVGLDGLVRTCEHPGRQAGGAAHGLHCQRHIQGSASVPAWHAGHLGLISHLHRYYRVVLHDEAD
mmetsp:Transcript_81918/g.253075  ORF Transcript_81918/g.253075 Transcript_81918/m.253075 type:complete len:269 (+) Transcript_81918:971-1777(+)